MVSHPLRPPRYCQYAQRTGSFDEAEYSEQDRRDCRAGSSRGGIDLQSVGDARAGGDRGAKGIGHEVVEGQIQKEVDERWG